MKVRVRVKRRRLKKPTAWWKQILADVVSGVLAWLVTTAIARLLNW